MEGSCSTGQSPQRAVVPVEEEEVSKYWLHAWSPYLHVITPFLSLTLRTVIHLLLFFIECYLLVSNHICFSVKYFESPCTQSK
jgi:hypothetical protein